MNCCLKLFLLLVFTFLVKTKSMAVQITQQNYNEILASNELVLILFHADWDRFSKPYLPVFHKAADIIAKEFLEPGKILLGEIDSDNETSISTQFNIWGLPRVVIIRNGEYNYLDYTGERTTEALTNFVRKQLQDPIKEFKQLKEVEESQSDKRVVIGYFDHQDQPEYNMYRRVATHFKDGCHFYVGFRKVSKKMHVPSLPTIIVKPKKYRNGTDESYPKSLDNFDYFFHWMSDRCKVSVRELTVDNMMQLTSDRLPFLILIHATNDTESIKQFTQLVETDLLSFKDKVNFATSNWDDIGHYVRKYNKTNKDVPLIIWHYYRQTVLFPRYESISVPGELQSFLDNLLLFKQKKKIKESNLCS